MVWILTMKMMVISEHNFLLNILDFLNFSFGGKGMMTNLKIWNFEDDK